MSEEAHKPEDLNQPATEESLPEGHNPDIGQPEAPASQPEAASEEDRLKAEVNEWKDKYFRLYAEFDNFRKRTAKERVELLSTASADVITELLPILDDFDRAVKANETIEDLAAVKEGFNLIHQKLYKKLGNKGLTPIVSNHQPFDVDFHEAITNIPAPTEELKGKVVDTVETGYMLGDKVIRFAKVVVGA